MQVKHIDRDYHFAQSQTEIQERKHKLANLMRVGVVEQHSLPERWAGRGL